MKVVLDTNILISAIFWRGAPYQAVLNALKRKYSLYVSPAILNELKDKLKNKFKFPENKIQDHIEILMEYGNIIKPDISVDVIKDDPNDDRILECAIFCNADYIISGDSHLLKLGEYKGVKILSAREFLGLIG